MGCRVEGLGFVTRGFRAVRLRDLGLLTNCLHTSSGTGFLTVGSVFRFSYYWVCTALGVILHFVDFRRRMVWKFREPRVEGVTS